MEPTRMRQPAKSKPSEVAETQRVLRIFDWLVDEMDKRGPVSGDALLTVAERIAARTSEDG